MNELESLILLDSIPLIGSVKIRLLLNYFGSAAEALKAKIDTLAALPGFGPKLIKNWVEGIKSETWKENLKIAERLEANILPFTDARFPKQLLEIADHPILLYIKGELKNIDRRSIAIVGTRNAGIYGMECAAKFAQDLAGLGFTIISGLARGIDTAAHQGALRTGRTLAVIGSGLADVYPRENISLAESISKSGAVISELPMTAPPDRQNFPRRNRIVSALSLGTLLIEAPIKSGAMITMEMAQNQNRKLFALPGRIDNDNFRGNHTLIKQGAARLVESAQDVAACFEDLFDFIKPQGTNITNFPSLSEEEQKLLNIMPNEEMSVEELLIVSKLPITKLNVLLTSLTFKRALKEFPGKLYKRV